MIKRILGLAATLSFVTSVAIAAVPGATDINAVNFTVHNLGYNNTQTVGLRNNQRTWYATNSKANQVCIFCHTPHNATRNNPLWNRVYPTGITYNLYTSSKSGLSAAAKGASLNANNESILCLSCHDGKTAVNVLHNGQDRDATQAVTGDAIINMGAGAVATALGDLSMPGGGYPANLGATRDNTGAVVNGTAGNNLSDDHPIGFSYASAQGSKPTTLKAIATVDPAIRFFGPARDRIECSSCHDPHVFYGYVRSGSSRVDISTLTGGAVTATQAQKDRTPFLVRDNNGSGLCLSCHIK